MALIVGLGKQRKGCILLTFSTAFDLFRSFQTFCRELATEVSAHIIPLPSRAKCTQQPAAILNERSLFIQGNSNDRTFGDFVFLKISIGDNKFVFD